MSDNAQLYFATLERAVKLVGGELELALLLKVTPSHLSLWSRRLESPPVDVFLRTVDIIAAYEETRGSEWAGNFSGTPSED